MKPCEIDWRKAPWNGMRSRTFDGKRFVAFGAVTGRYTANVYAGIIRRAGGLARIVTVADDDLQVWGHPNGNCRAYALLLDATPVSKRGYNTIKGGALSEDEAALLTRAGLLGESNRKVRVKSSRYDDEIDHHETLLNKPGCPCGAGCYSWEDGSCGASPKQCAHCYAFQSWLKTRKGGIL